jgi:hypothetical protein
MRQAQKEATTMVKMMMLVAIPWTTSVEVQTPENPKMVPEPKQFSSMAAFFRDSEYLLLLLLLLPKWQRVPVYNKRLNNR